MPCLSAFPEELLETVLSYCVLGPTTPRWHSLSSPAAPSRIRTRIAILLVCRSFYRIGTPLFYHTISIQSSTQLRRLLAVALRPNPCLATFIKHILMPGVWAEAGELLYRCRNNLRSLDITLDSTLNTQAHDPDAEGFCQGLHELKTLTHIVVRKPNNVYLTRPKLQYVLSEMTKAMQNWSDLEYVDLAFRLSDDSGGTAALLTMLPIPVPVHRPRSMKLPGPVTQLTQVLSSRPKLHTFTTHLPNVWNENILRVSQNPALQRIILVDGAGDAKDGTVNDQCPAGSGGGSGVAGTGHFFAQARRHTRLSELVRAGTSITRSRALTLGTLSNPGYPCMPSPVSPSSPSSYLAHPRPHDIILSHARETGGASPSPRASWHSHPWERYPSSLTPGSMGGSSSSQIPSLSTSVP